MNNVDFDPCCSGDSISRVVNTEAQKIKLLDSTPEDFSFVRYIGKHVMDYTHVHTVYEIYFCTESVKQRLVINGSEYYCDSPCVVISKPYTVHSMSCTDEGDVSYERFVIEFGQDYLTKYFFDRPEIKAMLEGSLGLLFRLERGCADYLREIITVFENEGGVPFSKAELGAAFSLFVSRLFSVGGKNITAVGTHSSYIHECMKYISENLSLNLDYNTLARRFAVSKSKLERDFKLACMISPREFADMCRLKKARELLGAEPTMSVAQISNKCGFSSETYLFTFFKKHIGLSPKEYRKALLSK